MMDMPHSYKEQTVSNKIQAKVAKILNSRSVVLNKGADAGVALNMIFKLYSSSGSVFDPDTHKPLGEVKIPMYNVKVTQVEELYSIAETFEYVRVNKGGSGLGIGTSPFSVGGAFEAPRYVKEYVNFEVTEEQAKALDEERSVVKVGDYAELIDSFEASKWASSSNI